MCTCLLLVLLFSSSYFFNLFLEKIGRIIDLVPIFVLETSSPWKSWGVLVLLVSVQILVRLDCFSHSITMEV